MQLPLRWRLRDTLPSPCFIKPFSPYRWRCLGLGVLLFHLCPREPTGPWDKAHRDKARARPLALPSRALVSPSPWVLPITDGRGVATTPPAPQCAPVGRIETLVGSILRGGHESTPASTHSSRSAGAKGRRVPKRAAQGFLPPPGAGTARWQHASSRRRTNTATGCYSCLHPVPSGRWCRACPGSKVWLGRCGSPYSHRRPSSPRGATSCRHPPSASPRRRS